MNNKLTAIIVIVLIAILLIVGILIFKVLVIDDKGENPNSYTKTEETPVYITLSKQVNEENNNQVIITVYASTDDENGIKQIVLPDGSTFDGETTTYTVEENGKYEFKAVSNSGKTASKVAEVTEIVEISSTNPYVPEGFSVVSDNVEEGYVIEDSYSNQYVWVPVESGKLTRNTILDSKYEETNSTASSLVNSVTKYYGFYIARYEASKYESGENVAAASIAGKTPWTNIIYTDADIYSQNAKDVFGYTDCQTALVNSYAWDTVLKWLDETYTNFSTNTNYGNYSGTIYPTGYTESDIVKNICDLAGNVREWTTEIYRGTGTSNNNKKDKEENVIQRVVRGGAASLSRTPSSHMYYPENLADNYWGFRTILYK